MIRYSRGMYGVSLGLFAFLLLAPAVLAKGIPTEVEITGPGIATAIRETNPLALPTLGINGFMDTSRIITPAADGDPSYEMTRDGGERVRFYPSPGGSCGAVLYIGDPGRIGTEFDNHWYRATCSGDVVFRTVLALHGITVPGDRSDFVALTQETTARAGSALVQTDAAWPRWLLPLAGVIGLALGLSVARAIPKRASLRR